MSSQKIIRLLIAEDDTTLRDALSLFISVQEGFEVVGKATDNAQAQLLCHQLKPDVILVDFDMPPAMLISFIQALHQQIPSTKIIIIASHLDGIEPQILEAGAARYIPKSFLELRLSRLFDR
jgi:DNA-binding NarL/FixJ family response regulator